MYLVLVLNSVALDLIRARKTLLVLSSLVYDSLTNTRLVLRSLQLTLHFELMRKVGRGVRGGVKRAHLITHRLRNF